MLGKVLPSLNKAVEGDFDLRGHLDPRVHLVQGYDFDEGVIEVSRPLVLDFLV
jgi:hypothetical protein